MLFSLLGVFLSVSESNVARFIRKQGSPLNVVVNLDVPDEVILARISDRWVHLPSGRVYNLSYNRPRVDGIDDETGEPLTKRPDDNPVRHINVILSQWFDLFLFVPFAHKGNIRSSHAAVLFNHFAAPAILQLYSDFRLGSEAFFAAWEYV